VNKRAIEALIKAGAFDAVHPLAARGRAQWLAGVAMAVQAADDAQNSALQGGLFDAQDHRQEMTLGDARLDGISPLSPRQMLLEEKSALGFCFSGSLFDDVRNEMRRWAGTALSRLQPTREPIWVAGVVLESRAQMTRRGMMRVVAIDDGTGRLEVTVFNELYDQRRHVLRVDEPLLIQARIENDEYSGGLRGAASEVLTLAEARMRYAKGIRLTLPLEAKASAQGLIQVLKSGAQPAAVSATEPRGPTQPVHSESTGCPVFIALVGTREACELQLGAQWRIVPTEDMLTQVRQAVGQAEVALVYPGDASDR
jgi:DNA polymerase-3 subunit alpha